jgi:hypothetical protein
MEEAIVLIEPAEFSETGKLIRVLDFFGIAAKQLTVVEFVETIKANHGGSEFRLLCTAATFLKFLALSGPAGDVAGLWQGSVHSAFIFEGGNFTALETLVSTISGGECLPAPANPPEQWIVTDTFPEFCKSMSGLRVSTTAGGPKLALIADWAGANPDNLVSDGRHSFYVRLSYCGVPTFISTAPNIIDIGKDLAGADFDIRQHFASTIPLVLYINWAFPESCWRAPEAPACLIIDDPLLKPRYGFLKFQRLLDLMRQRNFSTSIAFIPWNWRRNNTKVVQLFKENPERLSLSIHGCDHTGGEFGSLNVGRLAWKSRESLRRMWRHQSKTGLPHDAVMVFPQGVFSSRAMEVLKRSRFLGVVNSEILCTDSDGHKIKIEDYWQVGVLNYSEFPIFTRRYASAGIENFAFDILLGKPCLVVAHHNDCHDDCSHIADFMDRLNQLNARLHWVNLGEALRRSFRQRQVSPGMVEIEMYGSEVRVENPFPLRTSFHFRKRESAVEHIEAVEASGDPVRWAAMDDKQGLSFNIDLNPGESKIVKVGYKQFGSVDGFTGENLSYKLKAMVRRYLSEVRDNYITRKSFST